MLMMMKAISMVIMRRMTKMVVVTCSPGWDHDLHVVVAAAAAAGGAAVEVITKRIRVGITGVVDESREANIARLVGRQAWILDNSKGFIEGHTRSRGATAAAAITPSTIRVSYTFDPVT